MRVHTAVVLTDSTNRQTAYKVGDALKPEHHDHPLAVHYASPVEVAAHDEAPKESKTLSLKKDK